MYVCTPDIVSDAPSPAVQVYMCVCMYACMYVCTPDIVTDAPSPAVQVYMYVCMCMCMPLYLLCVFLLYTPPFRTYIYFIFTFRMHHRQE